MTPLNIFLLSTQFSMSKLTTGDWIKNFHVPLKPSAAVIMPLPNHYICK